MSIVRVGLGETKHFSEGYNAIFNKKKAESKKATASAKNASAKKKKKGNKKKA